MLIFLLACGSDDSTGTDAHTDVPPTGDCSLTEAVDITGMTFDDSLGEGDEVAIVSGPQGGFHMELGMDVVASGPDVAWRIDLFDVATGALVGSVGDTVFAVLTDWDPATCTGHLNGRVFIGDGTAQTRDFACELAGANIEARGWVAPLDGSGEIPIGTTQVTLEIVAGSAC